MGCRGRNRYLNTCYTFMIKLGNIEIPGFVIHSEEFMKDMDDRLKKTEQLLFAAEELLKCVPLNDASNGTFGSNIYLPNFNEALERYQELRKSK